MLILPWQAAGLVVAIFCVAVSVFAADELSPEQKLSRRIDELIAAEWATHDVTPAPLADDAEFLRRASLDLCGKIPAASTVRDFLSDPAPDKRERLVEKLLASPGYVIHATHLWRAAMIPEAQNEMAARAALPGFEAWLRSRIAENRNYAEIVDEVLTLPLDQGDVSPFAQPDRPTPAAFYVAKEGKPEALAAASARLFLGVRIDCAECHDHPFDVWKRDQFWQLAAFFAEVPAAPDGTDSLPKKEGVPGTIRIPETERTVSATFLDGQPAGSNSEEDIRSQLARWILSPNNPYFAKAAVNRLWANFFGLGLVEPMDDFSRSNPPSHPELLEELALAFQKSNYDFRFLARAIAGTQAYQLSSRQTHPSQRDARLFAKGAVRGLSPEQIFDSLAQAVGYQQPFDPEQPLNFNNDAVRQEFLATFENTAEGSLDRSSTILQALTLMNGRFVQNATGVEESRTLSAVIDAPFLNDGEKIDALYLSTLSRLPTVIEKEHLLKAVQARSSSPDAFADLFWVLLNSAEFLLNH
ncbi:DUF1549 and DUF1553 domain-containing protein [Planctomicrobium piriforme]|nr:DUF1549 and DUF1553 domain-containing protein [Planctomicrobium piriforme]